MHRYIFAAVLFLILNDCSSGKRGSGHVARAKPLISLDSIYDYGKVTEAVKRISSANKRLGSKLFLRALEVYRNKKNAAGSIDIFQQAISYYPTARSYYELGNALTDVSMYDVAENAYDMSLNLKYDPVCKVYYNKACVNSLRRDSMEAIDLLRTALENGYQDKDQFFKDKDLDNIRNTEAYKILAAKYFSGQSGGKTAMFTLFEAAFPKTALPFSVGDSAPAVFNEKNVINYDYAAFIPGMEESSYSRDVTDEYSYTANLLHTDSLIVLAYTKSETVADTLQPESTYLISFDRKRNIVDKLLIESRPTPLLCIAGKFGTDSVAVVNQYHNIWKNDPLSKGYQNNVIVGKTLIQSSAYKMDRYGHFNPVKPSRTFASKPEKQL